MAASSQCPDRSILRAYLQDELAVEIQDAVKAHVTACGSCDFTLRAMRGEDVPIEASDALSSKTSMNAGAEALDILPHRRMPARIGRYEIVAPIGAGGMGSVYKAFDPHLRRLVAIKVPHFPPGEAGAEAVERFLREARIAASLTQAHPHICAVHDVGAHDGTPFVVMAFVDGPSLAGFLECERLDDRAAVDLIRKVATALAVMHRHGIVHRDLKPSNILLTRAGEPLLTDFGLARPVEDLDRLTQSGVAVGTPGYMAPEQARGESPRAAADVYSLGVVLYQLLSGRLPFEDANLRDLLNQVAGSLPPPLSRHRPDVDRRLEWIVHKALAKDVSERYESAEALAADLAGWLAAPALPRAGLGAILGEASQTAPNDEPGMAPPTMRAPSAKQTDAAPQNPPVNKARSRRQAVWIAVGLSVVTLGIAGGTGGYFLTRGNRAAPPERRPDVNGKNAAPVPKTGGLLFATRIDPDGRALDPGTEFPADITDLYAVFRADTPPPGMRFSAKDPLPNAYYSHLIGADDAAPASFGWRWFHDGKIVNEYQTPVKPGAIVWLLRFDHGGKGIFAGKLGPGQYRIVVLLGGNPAMNADLVIGPVTKVVKKSK